MLLTPIRRSSRRRAAFTLLEVLVVVAILVILATVATVATTRYIEDAKKSKAQLGCQSIATAIEAYMQSPQNPGMTDDQKMPSGPQDLIQPPFGGPSFLRNGQVDTYDPWGKPYQFQMHTRGDGTTYILVTTTASDQTPISQLGIGPNAMPKQGQ
jgi:general secretion pathway protein G